MRKSRKSCWRRDIKDLCWSSVKLPIPALQLQISRSNRSTEKKDCKSLCWFGFFTKLFYQCQHTCSYSRNNQLNAQLRHRYFLYSLLTCLHAFSSYQWSQDKSLSLNRNYSCLFGLPEEISNLILGEQGRVKKMKAGHRHKFGEQWPDSTCRWLMLMIHKNVLLDTQCSLLII